MGAGQFDNDIIDQYTKEYAKNHIRKLKVFFKIFKKKKNKFITQTLPAEKSHFKKLLHASKAIHLGADQQIPMETLSLLGEIAMDPYYASNIRKIIKENMMEYNGIFYTLTDMQNQTKIQRALRTRKFQKVETIKAA